jgi:hypothetical protein
MATKICPNCSISFETSNNSQIYCTKNCTYNASKLSSGISKYNADLSSGTIGAISELRVATDLLNKGYEVYRALSPTCSGDLIAQKENKLFKIEVKTAQITKTGRLFYGTKNIRSEYLALVLKNEIIYKPTLI